MNTDQVPPVPQGNQNVDDSTAFTIVTRTSSHCQHSVPPLAVLPSITFANSFALLASDDEDNNFTDAGSDSDTSDTDGDTETELTPGEVAAHLTRKTDPLSKRKRRRSPSRRTAAKDAVDKISLGVTGKHKRRRKTVQVDVHAAAVPAPSTSASALPVPSSSTLPSSTGAAGSPTKPPVSKKNPIYLFFSKVERNPHRPADKALPTDKHYRCNLARPGSNEGRYFTITRAMNGNVNALVSHVRVYFARHFQVYVDLKARRELPSVLELRIAEDRASEEEIEQHLREVQKRISLLLPDINVMDFDSDVFLEILSDYIVACDQPFQEVERPEFRRLLQYLRGSTPLSTPSAQTLKRHVTRMSFDSFAETVELIKNIEGMVGLSTDLWTSENGHAFMATVMQWVNHDYEIQELLIDFCEVKGDHSGPNLGKYMWSTICKYGLIGKVIFIMADNATNNDTMIEYIAEQCREINVPFSTKAARGRCLPHTIHLSAIQLLEAIGVVGSKGAKILRGAAYQDAVDSSSPLVSETVEDSDEYEPEDPAALATLFDELDAVYADKPSQFTAVQSIRLACVKLRTLVRAIRVSPQRREAWYNILEMFPPAPAPLPDSPTLNTAPSRSARKKLPILDSPTRWSSTHEMMERGVLYEDPLNIMAARLAAVDPKIPQLSKPEWDAIKLVATWLKPFRDATTRMSTANTVTLSTVHVVFHLLQDKLAETLSTLPDNTSVALRQGLFNAHRKLSDYYQKFDESPFYTWAALLDPRISWAGMLHDCESDDELLAHVHHSRRKLSEHLHAYYAGSSAPSAPSSSSLSSGSNSNTDLFVRYRKPVSDGAVSLAKELDIYFALDPANALESGLDPLKWWQQHETQFPRVARFVRDLFACPASAVSVERVFSGARDTLSLRRASLHPDTISNLMLMKHKLRLKRARLEEALRRLA